ncbi:MAG: hypothetical protein J4F48_06020, partial [Nitrospinae bacterium]|nr:hypothetical protein [Nitrospinota bacterium]
VAPLYPETCILTIVSGGGGVAPPRRAKNLLKYLVNLSEFIDISRNSTAPGARPVHVHYLIPGRRFHVAFSRLVE